MAVQEPVYVGLDVGTSSLKAIAITSAGRAVAVEQADYPLLRPRPGWIEQHPDMWWEAACAALQRLLRRRTVADSRIAAVGVTGQMHGVTLLDAAGQVVRPSLIWPDNRGIVELAEFTLRIPAKDLLSISGSLPYASATLAKLLWLRAREPDTMARAAHILLAKDFLRLRLTDDYATDPTDASGTMLFNIRERRWSARVVSALGLDPKLLPAVRASGEIAGHVTDGAARATGLPRGVPVVVGGGDAECAAFSLALERTPDAALVSIGTAGQVFAVTDAPTIDPLGRIQTLCYVTPHQWHVMAAILAAGEALRWLGDVVGARDLKPLLSEAGETAPGASGLLFIPSLLGDRSPRMDPHSRGAFVGLTRSHTRAHLARAVIEGVAFALRDALEALYANHIQPSRLLLTGGPTRHPLWRRILADAMALPVTATENEHGSAFGAARLAARACGDDPVSGSVPHVSAAVSPDGATVTVYDQLYQTYRSVYDALRPAFHTLDAMSSPDD